MTKERAAHALDPITVEVVRNKLDGIANEMQSTLLQQLVLADRQGGDGLLGEPVHAGRETLAQACAIPDAPHHADPLRAPISCACFRSRRCARATSSCMNDPYAAARTFRTSRW